MNIMADSALRITFPSSFHITLRRSSYPILPSLSPKPPILNPRLHSASLRLKKSTCRVSSVQEAVGSAISLIQSSPPTWQSALASNLLIFLLGSPILVAGLSLSGIGAALFLGTLTWRAFGPSGFLLVSVYFIIGTAVTKVKMAQKEAQGIAEKRKGRRGPGSVVGSGAAGCVCSLLSIYGFGGEAFSHLWLLGFVASFCTKLGDTVSSEIGKAYGKTTYLVTTFKIVPRGTEGAVSVEGTIAGILASIVLAFLSYLLGKINTREAVICVLASQIANLGESFIGAVFQGKKGFQWVAHQ
ncbi:protein VTE6, chloroplastic-like isoform X2 [Prosopis cineraria]|uniref:protein VTE6, chloroplastic-like isoform X2 n=1 Tax=Prosopis cineraria TaxID=364024 RepID=UPI00240F48AC|nr:protein VTE6, chloroplastic-like isoform X2 [Prosopis cineraria]